VKDFYTQATESLIEEIQWAAQKHNADPTPPIVKTSVRVATQQALMHIVAMPEPAWELVKRYLGAHGYEMEEIGEEYYRTDSK
jgi:hypothetical protein